MNQKKTFIFKFARVGEQTQDLSMAFIYFHCFADKLQWLPTNQKKTYQGQTLQLIMLDQKVTKKKIVFKFET
jgi:hypothetical protein